MPLSRASPSIPQTRRSSTSQAGNGNIYKSVDGGATFGPSNGALTGIDIQSIDVGDDGTTVYAVDGNNSAKVYKSIDGGMNWGTVRQGTGFGTTVTVNRQRSNTLYVCGYGLDLQQSHNFGSTWQASFFFTLQCTTIAIDGTQSTRVYAASANNGVFALDEASRDATTITRLPATIRADGVATTTITVQTKDSSGLNLGGPSLVTLSTTAGTLGPITNPSVGVYRAVLTSSTTPTVATITGTVNGQPMVATTTVTFGPNHSPVLAPIGDHNAQIGSLLRFTVSATDIDDDVLSYNSSVLPAGANYDYGTRTFSWLPALGQLGNRSITFMVSDGTVTVSEVIVVHVSGRNNDVDADGLTDLLWRHNVKGANAYWRMDHLTFLAGVALPPVVDLDWKIVGMADLDFDGRADIIWRHAVNGSNAVWLLTGGPISGATLPGVTDTNWHVATVADLTGDGKPDIVWRNVVTGVNAVWELNGTAYVNGYPLPAATDLAWNLIGAADFNSDGKLDLLWHHQTSGANAVWFMDNTTRIGTASLQANTNPAWDLEGVADLTGDGLPDLIFRNTTTGDNAVWQMNGTVFVGASLIQPAPDTVSDRWDRSNTDWSVPRSAGRSRDCRRT